MTGQQLRPLGVGDIFDEGFDLYKRNFVLLLLAAAVAVVPLDIGLAFLRPRLLSSVFQAFGLTASSSDAFGVWCITQLASLTVTLPLLLLTSAPVVLLASARYLGHALTIGQAYRLCARRLPGLLLTWLLLAAALGISLVGCLVAWLPAATQLLFTLHAFLVEGQKPGRAMKRSSALGSGFGSLVFGCLLLMAAVAWILGLGVRLPLEYLFGAAFSIAPGGAGLYGGEMSAQAQVIAALSGGLAQLFSLPFLVCVATVLYYDLRVRKEGFDVEQLAERLGYPRLEQLTGYLPPAPVYGPYFPGRPYPGSGRPVPPPPGQGPLGQGPLGQGPLGQGPRQ